MAEELLDVTDAGAALEEVGRGSVPEQVRRDGALDAGAATELGDDGLDRSPADRSARTPTLGGDPQSAAGEMGGRLRALGEVEAKRFARRRAEWNDAIAAPLSEPDEAETAGEIDIGEGEARAFAETEGGGVEQLEDREGAALTEALAASGAEEPADLFGRERAARASGQSAGETDSGRGIEEKRTSVEEETKETSERGKVPLARRGGEAALVERGEIRAECFARDLAEILHVRFAAEPKKKGSEAIAARLDGSSGETAPGELVEPAGGKGLPVAEIAHESSPRMTLLVNALQVADLDARVDLRGVELGVAEDFLDVPDVGAPLE